MEDHEDEIEFSLYDKPNDISESTYQASYTAKISIEKYYNNLFRSLNERKQRYVIVITLIRFIDVYINNIYIQKNKV